MKKLSRHELMQYGTAIISFLIVMTFTLLIFFWFVQQSVDKSVQNVLQKNTLQQKDHLELVLEKEYEFLESPAAYFGTTSDLFSNDNLQLLAELASSSSSAASTAVHAAQWITISGLSFFITASTSFLSVISIFT